MSRKIAYFVASLVWSTWASAQCAMCKATAESGQAAGSSEATGLNAGILYLMAIPYVLMAAVAIAWYWSHKSKSSNP